MQPAVIEQSAAPLTTAGWGWVAIGFGVALLSTLVLRRAAQAPALRRFERWFNPIVVMAWLTFVWLAALRLLVAATWVGVAVRGMLLAVALVLLTPLLRDLIAAVTIALEGRHRGGDDVRVGELEGRIEVLGLRSVVLRRHDGSECSIPNRRFVASDIVRLNLPSGEAPCEFDILVPIVRGVAAASAELVEAALLSPYAAPGSLPEVFVLGSEPDGLRLRVRVFVFDRRYEDRYRSDILARMSADATSGGEGR
jgi:small-conductance mechanosensitive channel